MKSLRQEVELLKNRLPSEAMRPTPSMSSDQMLLPSLLGPSSNAQMSSDATQVARLMLASQFMGMMSTFLNDKK